VTHPLTQDWQSFATLSGRLRSTSPHRRFRRAVALLDNSMTCASAALNHKMGGGRVSVSICGNTFARAATAGSSARRFYRSCIQPLRLNLAICGAAPLAERIRAHQRRGSSMDLMATLKGSLWQGDRKGDGQRGGQRPERHQPPSPTAHSFSGRSSHRRPLFVSIALVRRAANGKLCNGGIQRSSARVHFSEQATKPEVDTQRVRFAFPRGRGSAARPAAAPVYADEGG
jgi:hypothetical protein